MNKISPKSLALLNTINIRRLELGNSSEIRVKFDNSIHFCKILGKFRKFHQHSLISIQVKSINHHLEIPPKFTKFDEIREKFRRKVYKDYNNNEILISY